jgi:hypothetical protein
MRSLEQLDRWIAAKIRNWTTHFAGRPESTTLLEVRRDILEDVRDRIEPAGEGKSVFPYPAIGIQIGVENEQQAAIVESAFIAGDALERELQELLAEAGCVSSVLVSVTAIEDAALARSGRPFRIEYSKRPAETARRREISSRPSAKLTVLRGEADVSEFAVHADRVNLGRLKEVVGERDGLRRRNDIAFADTETTVSREHAYIRYSASDGRFRLYDTHSQRGTSVFREGRRIEVPREASRGLQLRSGDEIHLGDARVLFTIDES